MNYNGFNWSKASNHKIDSDLLNKFKQQLYSDELKYRKCVWWWFSIMLKYNKFQYLAGIYNKIEANDMHMNVLSRSIIISDNDDEFDIYGNETDSHKIEGQSISKFIVVLMDWHRPHLIPSTIQNKISSKNTKYIYN